MRRVLALLALLLLGLPVQAGDSRPALIVSYRDNPPDMVSYCGERHSGPLRYVVEEAAARIGYRVEWRHLSLADSLWALKEGQLDVVPYLFTKTSTRAAIGRFSEPLGRKLRTVSFLVRKDEARSIARFADLAAFSIGYRRDSYYFNEFHESQTLQTVAYEKDGDMVRDFVAGRTDMLVVNNAAATERALLGLGFNEFKYAELTYRRDAQLFLLYSLDEGKRALFDRLDRAIAQMQQDGLMADIYRSFDTMPLK